MCHGSVDPKFLMQDAEARYRATAVAPTPQPSAEIPPELMGGLRGVWARVTQMFARAPRVHPAE